MKIEKTSIELSEDEMREKMKEVKGFYCVCETQKQQKLLGKKRGKCDFSSFLFLLSLWSKSIFQW